MDKFIPNLLYQKVLLHAQMHSPFMYGRITIYILTQTHHALIQEYQAPPTLILVRNIWQDFSLYMIHPPEAANAIRDTGI